MLTNGIIEFSHPEDMEASDDTFYTMIVLDNAERGLHKAVNVVVRKVTATTDLQTEFDIPHVINSTSYLIFRGSLLLSTALEDRVKISKDGTKLTIVDERDALEKGRSLYFVFIVDNNLLDRRVPRFIQDTFRCSRKLGDGTAIPEEWYTDPTFDEDKLIVFLGGRQIDRPKYDIRNYNLYEFLVGPSRCF